MKKTATLIVFCFFVSFFAQAIKVTVRNSTSMLRTNETVEVLWKTVKSKLALKANEKVIVVDELGREYPSQLVFEGLKEPQKLIFQVTLASKKTITLHIQRGLPQKYKTKTYGRFVPERKDDYAWENDRVAYRMYGPALVKTDGPSNGIDIWCKRTDELILDERYSKELSGKGNYHTDWGNGLDFYKVGRTLGAGAMAPFVNDSLWLSSNFVSQETLDNGPIRTTFRLTYAPFNVNGNDKIVEIRTISLDAGSQMNKIVEYFKNAPNGMTVAAGMVMRNAKDTVAFSAKDGYAIYFEPKSDKNGELYLATVYANSWKNVQVSKGHLLTTTNYSPNSKLTYYAGNGWSKWGFATSKSWIEYVKSFALKLRKPLEISVK